MMTCTQFRESLNAYVDGELSLDAAAAADVHRLECAACARDAAHSLALKSAVREAVLVHDLPPGFEERVRAAIPNPVGPAVAWSRIPRLVAVAASVAALILCAAVLRAATGAPSGRAVADAFEGAALRMDDSSAIVLEGTLLCRDCELEHRYGIEASCRTIGHHGALATADGRIWNIVDQRTSSDLIHDQRLLGRRLVVTGRVFRGSRALVVESYKFSS